MKRLIERRVIMLGVRIELDIGVPLEVRAPIHGRCDFWEQPKWLRVHSGPESERKRVTSLEASSASAVYSENSETISSANRAQRALKEKAVLGGRLEILSL